jgi:hypothetical protein
MGHERSKESHSAGGLSKHCEESDESGPHRLCKAPISFKLVALEKDDVEYYFDDRVRAVRTEDMAFTKGELDEIAQMLDDALTHHAKEQGLGKVVKLSAPSETAFNCRISASIEPGQYTFNCTRPGDTKVQVESDRRALRSRARAVAKLVLTASDPTKPMPSPTPASRVVILVDVSLSMVINDESTFTSDDIRRSKRYELVLLMLRGMQENGLSPEVAIVGFSGEGCLQPVLVDGKQLWSLTDESRDAALEQLRGFLRQLPKSCADSPGTDLVGPMRKTAELLAGPKPKLGKDVAVLITDGAHQAQVHGVRPQTAAAELGKAGIELAVVLLQLNDLTDLRTRLDGSDKLEIVHRWGDFVDDHELVLDRWDPKGEKEKEKGWLKIFLAENNEGEKLLEDLSTIDISRAYLSSHDSQSEPLLITHEMLLPQLGGIEPVFASNAILPDQNQGPDGRPVVQTVYEPYIIRGRPFTIRIKKPECMGRIVSAKLTAAAHEPKYLKVLWEDGAIVTFEDAEVDRFPGDEGNGRTMPNQVKLLVDGEPVGGVQKCQR